MTSLSRLLLIVGIYLAYLFGIIFLVLPSNVPLYLVLLFLGVGLFLLVLYTGWGMTSGKTKWLIHNGRDAEATILSMKDTGLTVNYSPYVSFRLRVTPTDAAPFEAGLRAFVSRIAIPSVGDTVRVKYDPENPQRIIMV